MEAQYVIEGAAHTAETHRHARTRAKQGRSPYFFSYTKKENGPEPGHEALHPKREKKRRKRKKRKKKKKKISNCRLIAQDDLGAYV